MTNVARIVVHYPRARGSIFLRGEHAPLAWTRNTKPIAAHGDESTFEVRVAVGETLECKLVRADGAWAAGRNLVLAAGDHLDLHPSFGDTRGELRPVDHLALTDGSALNYRVFLPPSYAEQDAARYPVLYAQDGQSLWSDHDGPAGVWDLDHVLAELWSLSAVQEIIVVSIDTASHRLDRFGPVPDPDHGGGRAAEHLAAIVGSLKPHVDRTLRTLAHPKTTAVLGSSMGGLFSFYAAWNRPDVFGAAICLSSSFWWADRWAIRHAQSGTCPMPRPLLYLDSGAAHSALERDASARDGQHHTRAMERALVRHCYEPGKDLHVLTFPGHRHDSSSWAARVAIPLQLVFPRGHG